MVEGPDAKHSIDELHRAISLANNRLWDQAATALRALVEAPGALSNQDQFRALLTLARCCRLTRNIAEARYFGLEALNRAAALHSRSAGALAFEGLAITEGADHQIANAGAYFEKAAELELNAGNLQGVAATLCNYANMLIQHDMEGAESLLRRAAQNVGDQATYAATIYDNFALEMSRQGRHAEAVSWGEKAIVAYEQLNLPHDLFLSLRNLAASLYVGDRREEAGRAFVRAHDLIHALRAQEVDVENYRRYPERVAQIEEASGHLPDALGDGGLFVAVNAYMGQGSYEEGQTLLEAGSATTAIDKFMLSRTYWQKLEARHMLIRVDHHLALAYAEIGDLDRSIEMSYAVREEAQALGDADRELAAISNLIRLRDRIDRAEVLDLFAQGAVLERLLAGAPVGNGMLLQGHEEMQIWGDGVLASLGAALARESGADELASSYFRYSIRVAQHMPDGSRHRLVFRLVRFLEFLTATGQTVEAVAVRAELKSAAESIGDDARVRRALLAADSRIRYEDGERSTAVLRDLMLDCETYELQREEFLAGRRSGLEEFSARLGPPYTMAASVAAALGHLALSVKLADRGRASALRLALGLPEEPFPKLESDSQSLVRTATQTEVTLLPVPGETLVLVARAESPIVLTSVKDLADSAGLHLADAVRRLTQTSDSRYGADKARDALQVVLQHPGFQQLAAKLALVANEGLSVLSAHGYLLHAPLHIRPADGTDAEPAWILAPSLAVADRLHAEVSNEQQLIAFGDPSGDLPFARAEALLIGGDRAIVGRDCTAANLEAECAAGAGVVHVACHGRYDVRNYHRSGLVMAPEPDDDLPGTNSAHLLDIGALGSLALEGSLVVLGACSSGLEIVHGGDTTGLVTAMLKAGAEGIVAARWPVPDLSAMYFMVDFHDRLVRDPSIPVAAMLAQSRQAVRNANAITVVERGFDLSLRLAASSHAQSANLVAAGVLQAALRSVGDRESTDLVARLLDEANGTEGPDTLLDIDALRTLAPTTNAATTVMPFADPVHWGAFVIVGGTRSAE